MPSYDEQYYTIVMDKILKICRTEHHVVAYDVNEICRHPMNRLITNHNYIKIIRHSSFCSSYQPLINMFNLYQVIICRDAAAIKSV